MTKGETLALSMEAKRSANLPFTGRYWQIQTMHRLSRDLQAAADTGHELPEETLKAARDFLGVLVGR